MAAVAASQTLSVAPAADQACLLCNDTYLEHTFGISDVCIRNMHTKTAACLRPSEQTWCCWEKEDSSSPSTCKNYIANSTQQNNLLLDRWTVSISSRSKQHAVGVQAAAMEEDSRQAGAEADDFMQQALQDAEVGLCVPTLGCLMHLFALKLMDSCRRG